MRLSLLILGLALVNASIITAPLRAAGPGVPGYDPTDYLRQQEIAAQKEQEANQVKPSNIVIGGVPYIRFETQSGSVYLPKVMDLKQEDLDRALCGGAFRPSDLQTATVAAAEVSLTEKTKLYARAIIDTARTRCTGESTAVQIPLRGPDLEVGSETMGAGRDPTTYSIFNRNLAPNIGVRADF